jgi:hydrogenase maturation protease
MTSSSAICIIGIGNTLMGDDGIGAYICAALERYGFPGVEVRTAHQLQTEWIFELARFGQVVIVDASLGEEPFTFRPLQGVGASSANISHHLDPSLIFGLLTLLEGRQVRFMICAVAGRDFGFGEGLSAIGRAHADAALAMLIEWLRNETATGV